MTYCTDTDVVLLTGATGLVGQYVLADLLKRGWRCATLLRPPLADSSDRLAAALWELGLDADALIAREQLIPLEGELGGELPRLLDLRLNSIVHAAAATNFSTDHRGEPRRTNVQGTSHLLEWASQSGIENLHLVSSAYVCGRTVGPVEEVFVSDPPSFHNDYERSKWEAEQLCLEWAQRDGRVVTIHRPSVIVGEYHSGRSTKFSGMYLPARATELLARIVAPAGVEARHSIQLRIRGRSQDCQNIVPVDYVAAAIGAIVSDRAVQGGVFHLVHPDPPSNALIKRAFEAHFDIGGGRFVPPERFPAEGLNDHEQRFYEVSRPVEHYFIDTPSFGRRHVERIERSAGLAFPSYDVAAIGRLVAYAQSVDWGRGRATRRSEVPGCAYYFESFLPTHVGKSRIARMTGLSAAMRFVIEDEDDGEWFCRFDHGRLACVGRGDRSTPVDFGYCATREVFWEAISGRVHPQELFLSGRAELFGDIERALKMALILHEFTKEFPCVPQVAADEVPLCPQT